MSKEIRTRSTIRDIKVFDRAADVGKHMKDVVVRTKGAVEFADKGAGRTQDTGYGSPSEYASDSVTQGARSAADKATRGLRGNPVKKASENINKAKANIGEAKRQFGEVRNTVKNTVKKPAADAPRKETVRRVQDTARHTASRTRRIAEKPVGAIGGSGKTVGRAAHGADKTIKTASKTVKGTANPIGVGTDSEAAWSGVRPLCLGVPTSADISKRALSRNLPLASRRASRGSNNADCIKTVVIPPCPVT
jgi:hypothetical protein